MNLRHLEAFREVMLTGSVSQAARNLGRTQPAVSNLIARLEDRVGYPLFERRGGRLHPVPEAHFLLEQARPLLAELASLDQTMREAGALEAGRLRIACMPVIAEQFMPRVISRFARARRRIRIHLVSRPSPQVYEGVASQQFDVGFAEVAAESSLVTAEELALECVCGLPAGDPLAGRDAVTPADLAGRACATFLPGHHIRERIEELFAAEGHPLQVRFEVQNAGSQYTFVEDGLAFAVMSELSARIYQASRPQADRIAFVPLRPRVPYHTAILVPAHRPASRIARAFVETLRRELAEFLAD